MNIDKTSEKKNSTIDEKKEKRKKSLFLELIRFGIVGVVCAIVEMALQFILINYVCKPTGLFDYGDAGYYGSWAIAYTLSFIVSVLLNYLLSRFFVYQNVSKDADTKSAKAFWIYFWLAVGGWLIGLGIFELLVWACNAFFGIAVDPDITKGFSDAQNAGSMVFWSWLIIFAVKTLIVMFYNYITRKIIIFKKPKNNELVEEKEEEIVKEQIMDEPTNKVMTRDEIHEKVLIIHRKHLGILTKEEAEEKVDQAIKRKGEK